jgi:hypothetical protein
MKLLITQFSPASSYFIPLGSKCSPQDPMLKHHAHIHSLHEESYLPDDMNLIRNVASHSIPHLGVQV